MISRKNSVGEMAGMVESDEEMTEQNIMFLATGGQKHETESAA